MSITIQEITASLRDVQQAPNLNQLEIDQNYNMGYLQGLKDCGHSVKHVTYNITDKYQKRFAELSNFRHYAG